MKVNSIALIALLVGLCLCSAAHAQKKGGGGKGGGGGGEVPSAAETNPAIAFVVGDKKPGSFLVVASADLGSEIRLNNFANDEVYTHGPSWSPDGSQVAFWEADTAGSVSRNRLVVVNADGTGRRVVRDFYPYESVFNHGEWSPSGKELLYSAAGGIYSIDLQTGVKRKIVLGDELYGVGKPSISPQAVLAFAVEVAWPLPAGKADVWLASLELDAEGYLIPFDLSNDENAINFTNTPELVEGPWCWSLDGNWLAYATADGESYAVFLEHVVTRNRILVSTTTHFPYDGTMSSDGRFIIYRNGVHDLMIAPTDGSTGGLNYTKTRNAGERYPAWNPAWDPDGDGGF